MNRYSFETTKDLEILENIFSLDDVKKSTVKHFGKYEIKSLSFECFTTSELTGLIRNGFFISHVSLDPLTIYVSKLA